MSAHGLVSRPRGCEVPREPDYTTSHKAGGQSIPECCLPCKRDLRCIEAAGHYPRVTGGWRWARSKPNRARSWRRRTQPEGSKGYRASSTRIPPASVASSPTAGPSQTARAWRNVSKFELYSLYSATFACLAASYKHHERRGDPRHSCLSRCGGMTTSSAASMWFRPTHRRSGGLFLPPQPSSYRPSFGNSLSRCILL